MIKNNFNFGLIWTDLNSNIWTVQTQLFFNLSSTEAEWIEFDPNVCGVCVCVCVYIYSN